MKVGIARLNQKMTVLSLPVTGKFARSASGVSDGDDDGGWHVLIIIAR